MLSNNKEFSVNKLSMNEFCDKSNEFFNSILGSININEKTDLIQESIVDSIILIAYLNFIVSVRGKEFINLPNITGSFTYKTAYEIYLS